MAFYIRHSDNTPNLYYKGAFPNDGRWQAMWVVNIKRAREYATHQDAEDAITGLNKLDLINPLPTMDIWERPALIDSYSKFAGKPEPTIPVSPVSPDVQIIESKQYGSYITVFRYVGEGKPYHDMKRAIDYYVGSLRYLQLSAYEANNRIRVILMGPLIH